MEQLYELSLAITVWLQQTYPQIVGSMRVISALGSEQAFLLILPAVYWCVDKRIGRQLGYVFLLSAAANGILKNALRQPRPFWLDPNVELIPAEGYGAPSGHVQNVTVLVIFLAAIVRRFWLWLLSLLVILLMTFCRVYLGAHFIPDGVTGFVAGLLVLGVFAVARYRFEGGYARRIMGQRMLVMIIAPVVLAVAYVGMLLILGPPDLNVPWAAHIPAAELETHEDVVAAIAGLLGFGVGMVLESGRVRFRTAGPAWLRVARYVLGIAVALAIWGGLGAVFPRQPEWLAMPLRFGRYSLLLLWVTYFAPWLFVKLSLAQADPESEIKVTFTL